MNAAEHYSYRVSWSADDGEFVGTVLELPSLSWLEPESAAAFAGIRKLASEVVEDLAASGEEVPEPLSARRYDGELRVRGPPGLSRGGGEVAGGQGISMNRLANHKLSA
mgnify:CR=1 FL=1